MVQDDKRKRMEKRIKFYIAGIKKVISTKYEK